MFSIWIVFFTVLTCLKLYVCMCVCIDLSTTLYIQNVVWTSINYLQFILPEFSGLDWHIKPRVVNIWVTLDFSALTDIINWSWLPTLNHFAIRSSPWCTQVASLAELSFSPVLVISYSSVKESRCPHSYCH